MITFPFKPLLIAVGLSLLSTNTWALLIADKSTVNNETGAVTIRVSFSIPVLGDLYLATLANEQLYFFADNGNNLAPNLTSKVTPLIANTILSGEKPVLILAPQGIPPNVYPLYQVVTYAGKSPLDFNNWIGGVGSLSQLNLRINLPTEQPPTTTSLSAVPTIAPTAVNPPSPAPAPAPSPAPIVDIPTPTTNSPTTHTCVTAKSSEEEDDDDDSACKPTPTPTPALDGKKTYTQYCASCHGSNPSANANKILEGKEANNILEAISENKGGLMGALKGRISVAEINVIATYLRTFQKKSTIND